MNDQRMVDVEMLEWIAGFMEAFPQGPSELTRRVKVLNAIISGPGVEPVAEIYQDPMGFKCLQFVRSDYPILPNGPLYLAAPSAPVLPADATVERNFDYSAAEQAHYPTIKITFPPNHWKTRDRIADALVAPVAPVQAVPDWLPEVVAFATAMESKLKANDHKGGWSGCAKHWLMMRIVGEAIELLNELKPEAIAKAEFYAASRLMDAAYGELDSFGPHLKTTCDPKRIIEEAADIANFAMMLADVSGALEHAPKRPLPEDGGESTAQSVACPTSKTCATCSEDLCDAYDPTSTRQCAAWKGK